MKRNLFTILLTPVLVILFQPVFAESSNQKAESSNQKTESTTQKTADAGQVADNFNSRSGVRLSEVKGHLQGNCWFFSDFDINRNGWSPNMEGDGAMVSGTGASATEKTGIYTPLLDLSANTPLTFTYKFNLPVQDRRWIKIYAADANDRSVLLLDSLELTGSDNTQVYRYHQSLSVPAGGQYRLYINYQGIGGGERIAIDQLEIGATPHYQSTCNTAPVALKDKFNGTASRTANGNVLGNDYDPNQEMMTAYLLTESPDGRVDLQKDGSFAFTPKEGFTGNSTHFAYKVCDNGSPALCSITTTATLLFPSRSALVGFQALYRKSAVDINWSAATDNHSNRFEIERSLDGNNFEKIGEVKAEEALAAGEYAFTDKVHDNMARKNDLYYRLRQLDAASRVTYSKVLIVRTYETKSVTAVTVTPDPGVNDIQVNVQLKEKSFVVMRVTDSKGSELIRQTAFGENGANTYNVEGTSLLLPGSYQLEVIINSNERLTMRLAKS